MTEEEYSEKQFEIKGEIPEPLETLWAGPTPVMLVPPRDWPPRGWEVDREELAFMREAHKMLARRVRLEELEEEGGAVVVSEDSATDGIGLERYKVFLKQYEEWVEANRDRLEQESYEVGAPMHIQSQMFS